MGIFQAVFGPGFSLSDESASEFLSRSFFPGNYGISKTGIPITADNALSFLPVYAAVRIIAGSLAHLPAKVMQRVGQEETRDARQHPSYSVLHDAPNDRMTAITFYETLQSHVLLWGNAYAEIIRNGRGQAAGLIPLLPDRTCPILENGKLFYETKVAGQTIPLRAENVLHIPGLSFDGLKGYSPISIAREAIGLGKANEEFSARFYLKGAANGGFVQHPAALSDQAHQRLREKFEAENAGLTNAHRIIILEEGMTFSPMTIPQKDAQFIEGRTFQIQEIARLFNLPPHKLKDLTKSSFSNIEMQSIEYVTDTLMPWIVRWEQEMNRKLFTRSERSVFFTKFNVKGLLRGTNTERAEYYKAAINDGWMTRNEVRKLEDLNPIDGLDTVLEPLNMQPVGEEDQEENEDVQDDLADGD